MLTAVRRSPAQLEGDTDTLVRGFCECQDTSHPMLPAPEQANLPAGVAPEHGFRAPFIARGARYLHTTPVGAFPICGPCHELGHMAEVR